MRVKLVNPGMATIIVIVLEGIVSCCEGDAMLCSLLRVAIYYVVLVDLNNFSVGLVVWKVIVLVFNTLLIVG